MKQPTALLMSCAVVGIAMMALGGDPMTPARVPGAADFLSVRVRGSWPASTGETGPASAEALRAASAPALAPVAGPANAVPFDRPSEQLAALGRSATATELANAAAAAVTASDAEVRVQALELLGDTRQPRYVPILAVALADGDGEVRVAALLALARHGSAEALYTLHAALPNLDDELRQFAAAMLADRTPP